MKINFNNEIFTDKEIEKGAERILSALAAYNIPVTKNEIIALALFDFEEKVSLFLKNMK